MTGIYTHEGSDNFVENLANSPAVCCDFRFVLIALACTNLLKQNHNRGVLVWQGSSSEVFRALDVPAGSSSNICAIIVSGSAQDLSLIHI